MKIRMTALTLPLLLAFVPIRAQHAEKTLVKAFNLKGQTEIFLDVEGSVNVTTWNEPQMRVQMTITLQNGSETMLKSLVTAGRYNLDSDEENGEYRIVAPGLDRQVKFSSGRLLGEQISFTVFAPKDVTVKTRNDEATGLVEK